VLEEPGQAPDELGQRSGQVRAGLHSLGEGLDGHQNVGLAAGRRVVRPLAVGCGRRPATAPTGWRRLVVPSVLEAGGVNEGAAVVVGDQYAGSREGLVVLVDGAG
jgi:hypothetical protein